MMSTTHLKVIGTFSLTRANTIKLSLENALEIWVLYGEESKPKGYCTLYSDYKVSKKNFLLMELSNGNPRDCIVYMQSPITWKYVILAITLNCWCTF